jgi:hypothetical protein
VLARLPTAPSGFRRGRCPQPPPPGSACLIEAESRHCGIIAHPVYPLGGGASAPPRLATTCSGLPCNRPPPLHAVAKSCPACLERPGPVQPASSRCRSGFARSYLSSCSILPQSLKVRLFDAPNLPNFLRRAVYLPTRAALNHAGKMSWRGIWS